MHQPGRELAGHEAEVSMLAHRIKQLFLGESALDVDILLVLSHGLVLAKRKRAAAEIASKALLSLFFFCQMPAEHFKHEGDFESLVVDLIKRQHFLEQEGVGRQKSMESSAVEKREGIDGFVEIHLAADVVHAQVKLLPADPGRLFVVIQTALLMQADALQQLSRVCLDLLGDCDFFEADVALEQIPGDGAEAERGEKIGIELFVRRVDPERQLIAPHKRQDSLEFV